jgi:ABC-type molybdate transport system substrate-binding protein
MIDLEDKRIKIAVILVAIVGFATYYFYPKDDYVMEMVKPTRPPVQKVEEIKELNKKEILIAPKVEIKEKKAEDEKQIIERGNVLFTETDPSGRYTIQLLNAIDINLKNNDNSRNITIFGQIEDNSIKTDFSISIGEEYINYLSDLKIKIVDSVNNERVIETASYFLGALDLNSSYKIKFNISGDTLDGEVISSDKLPEDILKEIENTEQKIVDNEEKDEKEN